MTIENINPETLTKPLISINPSTGEELGRVIPQNVADIDRAYETAKNSFVEWSQRPIRERQHLLRKLSALILEEKEQIAELITREQGKPVSESLVIEIISTLAILKDLSKYADKELKPHRPKPQQILIAHKKNFYRFEPYGVIVIIAPWNFPFSVPLPEIAAALVAGNVVIFKPAPQSILVGQVIDSLFQRAGFPHGVLQTLLLDDKDAPYLAQHADADKIIFTGSTEVGQKIMVSAAKHITPHLLELGGKDPAIIAKDAELKRAANACVWGATYGSGQACASVERVYVEKQVADQFIAYCREFIEKIKVGDPLAEGTDMGPLSVKEQLDIVQDHINDAVKKGAKVLYGGRRIGTKGYFFMPTLLTNVDHSMKVMTEETFGPVLPIMAVEDIDEAIRLANDTPYGLSAYGWTSSKETADRLICELHAGTVMINDVTSSWGEPTAPWGGFKKSGLGRTRSRFGLMEMVQVKYASLEKSHKKHNLWWHPYGVESKQFFLKSIDLLYNVNLFVKIRALLAMLKNKRFIRAVHWRAILTNLKKLY